MKAIDEVLEANAEYASGFDEGNLPKTPGGRLAIVACMDARMDMPALLGLNNGDAHVIRNAGGIVSEDVIRSLVISHHLLGVREIMVINHTDCGLLTFKDDELRDKLKEKTGTDSATPTKFHAFSNLEKNVREQTGKIRSHPWMPDTLSVRGLFMT